MKKKKTGFLAAGIGGMPLFLILFFIMVIVSAVSAAPKTPPVMPGFDEKPAIFHRIDRVLSVVDERAASIGSKPTDHEFFYAAWFTLFSDQEFTDDELAVFCSLGYTANDQSDPPILFPIRHRGWLFSNLNDYVYDRLDRYVTDEEERQLFANRDWFRATYHKQYISPLYGLDILPFIKQENVVIVSYPEIDNECAAAVSSGTVTSVTYDQELGNIVIITHSDGYSSTYSHLFNVYVTEGQEIDYGELIGQIGESGITDDPCLYFEIRKHGTRIDPRILYDYDTNLSLKAY